jgi:hypothetical protein
MELGRFDTQEGQQMSKLESFSTETAQAWKWIQENRDKFVGEVYGPPLISCSVKDPRYTDAVEALMHKGDFLAITAQSLSDMKNLSDQLHGVMNLSVTIRSCTENPQDRRPLTQQELQKIGMDGYAIDFLDGPGPVLSMLSDSARLDMCPITLSDISEQQYDILTRKLSNWVTGTQHFQVSRRAEYGPSATSTITRSLRKATHWTDQPVDTSARRDLEAKIESLENEFESMKLQALPLRNKVKGLQEEGKNIQKEIVSRFYSNRMVLC